MLEICRREWTKPPLPAFPNSLIYTCLWLTVEERSGQLQKQSLIKQGACMREPEWSCVGEGLLREQEIQETVLAVHEYVSLRSLICVKWSRCIVCIASALVWWRFFFYFIFFLARKSWKKGDEEKMEAKNVQAEWERSAELNLVTSLADISKRGFKLLGSKKMNILPQLELHHSSRRCI